MNTFRYTKPVILRRCLAAGMAVTLAIGIATHAVLGLTAHADGNDTIYVTPASGSFVVNQTFGVELRANSNNEQVNAVQVEMGYSANTLQVLSIDIAGSAYNVDAQKTAVNGKVVVARGNTSPLTGDKLIARVYFKVIATGNGTLDMQNGSVLVSHSNNQNIADTRSGASFGLSTPPPPGPVGPPGRPGPPGPSGPAGKPYVTTSPVPRPSPGSAPNVSVTPNPTSANPTPAPVILPDESEFEIDEPTTVEVTPSGEREVEKVEYLVNGKLKMTVNEPPYTYSVDTTNMRNGKYTLTIKTHYKDGTTDETKQDLIVKNPFGAKQLMLQLKHYAWLIILLLLIIGGLIWFLFFRNRDGNDFGDGYGDYGSDTSGYDPYAVPPPPVDPNQAPPPADPTAGNPNDPYGRY